MKKLAAISAAALMGLGTLGMTSAEARGGRGGAIAAGVVGGLAAGALAGAAGSRYYGDDGYGPRRGYGAYGYRGAGYDDGMGYRRGYGGGYGGGYGVRGYGY